MEKFFLQSKTILGALLAIAVNLAPLVGLSFSGEDATQITQGWDAILNGISAILVVWGRVSAELPIRWTLFGTDESGSVLFLPMITMLLIGLIALSACGSQQVTARLQDFFECQTLAAEQGLTPGTDEQSVFVTSCLAGQAADDIIRNLIIDDDVFGGGGKL